MAATPATPATPPAQSGMTANPNRWIVLRQISLTKWVHVGDITTTSEANAIRGYERNPQSRFVAFRPVAMARQSNA